MNSNLALNPDRPGPAKLGPIGLKCGPALSGFPASAGTGRILRCVPSTTAQTGHITRELDVCRYSAYRHRASHHPQMSSAGFQRRTI